MAPAAQPRVAEAYTTAGNPAETNPAEEAAAAKQTRGGPVVQKLGPDDGPDKTDALPSSLGQGVTPSGHSDGRGVIGGERSSQQVKQNENVDAEQLATLSEGKVADAVQRKSGTQRHGDQDAHSDDYAADLDRKKAEQEEAREAVKEERRAGQGFDDGMGAGRSGVQVD